MTCEACLLIKEGREMSSRSLACKLVLKDLAAITYQHVEDIKMESTQELSHPLEIVVMSLNPRSSLSYAKCCGLAV